MDDYELLWDRQTREQRIQMVILWQLSDGSETTRLLLEMLSDPQTRPVEGWSHDFEADADADGVVATLLRSEAQGWVTRRCTLGQPDPLTAVMCVHEIGAHPIIGGDPSDVEPTDIWWELTPAGHELVRQWASQFSWYAAGNR